MADRFEQFIALDLRDHVRSLPPAAAPPVLATLVAQRVSARRQRRVGTVVGALVVCASLAIAATHWPIGSTAQDPAGVNSADRASGRADEGPLVAKRFGTTPPGVFHPGRDGGRVTVSHGDQVGTGGLMRGARQLANGLLQSHNRPGGPSAVGPHSDTVPGSPDHGRPGSSDPGAPTYPNDPGAPNRPGQPVNPGQPVDPAQPARPGQPEPNHPNPQTPAPGESLPTLPRATSVDATEFGGARFVVAPLTTAMGSRGMPCELTDNGLRCGFPETGHPGFVPTRLPAEPAGCPTDNWTFSLQRQAEWGCRDNVVGSTAIRPPGPNDTLADLDRRTTPMLRWYLRSAFTPGATVATLHPGNTLRYKEFTCTAQQSGVRCTNTATGAWVVSERNAVRMGDPGQHAAAAQTQH